MTHIADDAEYGEKLREKCREEVEEFLRDPSVEELADLLEVLDATAMHEGLAGEEVARAREKKAEERGRFKERIILDES